MQRRPEPFISQNACAYKISIKQNISGIKIAFKIAELVCLFPPLRIDVTVARLPYGASRGNDQISP